MPAARNQRRPERVLVSQPASRYRPAAAVRIQQASAASRAGKPRSGHWRGVMCRRPRRWHRPDQIGQVTALSASVPTERRFGQRPDDFPDGPPDGSVDLLAAESGASRRDAGDRLVPLERLDSERKAALGGGMPDRRDCRPAAGDQRGHGEDQSGDDDCRVCEFRAHHHELDMMAPRCDDRIRFAYRLVRKATWHSSGSFPSAAAAAALTPSQASPKP